MRWKITAQPWNDSANAFEIRAATSRSMTARLRAPSTAQFTMSGFHEQAAMVEELVTDIIITCQHKNDVSPQTLFRGRCGNTQDTIGETIHSVAFQFADYRAMLERRYLDGEILILSADPSVLSWNMIFGKQAEVNASMGITQASGNAQGYTREITEKLGDPLGKKIWELSGRDPGWDWDILPENLQFKMWASRGVNNNEILEYGKTVSTLTRTRTPGDYANALMIVGGEGTQHVTRESAGLLTDPRGRWEDVYSFPSVTIQSTLDQHGDKLIDQTVIPNGSYNVTLKPGFWRGPSHIWLGDPVTFRVISGRLNESLAMRVFEISIEIKDNGQEKVRMVLVKT